ncbi:crotonase/enoyl-CoA hydratase family protein [Mesorhizobium sp. M5C.F.Ca.IN.020.32.2.1]|uniref:crotonase/enoyl-CoA hydratase family protein n=1 Tax=Mesorhizobium sp. M5C.F.Ca.IN.020.32.2.1 TaxID=2496771 RepID=UPI000FD39893|nr:crotonase/enoyl-CoA hydratase family protein [Mesorhizobium sp. M5C.F.Ca.IN.020.32.2.1]RUV32803.1 crotonase/enoyl-CoA hydratase family protein [Mesorhizobium sp. M5C.F.Ca.IN.020.32.2.1]
MNFNTIRVTTDEIGVATLTLARPDKHNALSGRMIAELAGAAELLANDVKVRAVVLTGEGDSFCAGADLGWMRAQASAARNARIAEARKLALVLRALNELPKPLIGRINGQAFGGGLGLTSVCDAAVAVNTAKFGFTEVRLGLIPATISPYVLARMGEGRARRVFMSARIFNANEACELGLVARAVPPADLDAAVEGEVRHYCSASPQAVAAAKALARRLGPAIDDAIINETVALLADTWETSDASEGIAAFFDRRRPRWQA